jgi:hypothetical protein
MTWDEWKLKSAPPKPPKKTPTQHAEGLQATDTNSSNTSNQDAPTTGHITVKAKDALNHNSSKKTSAPKVPLSAHRAATGSNRTPLGKRNRRLDYRIIAPDYDMTTPPDTYSSGPSDRLHKGKQKAAVEYFEQVQQALKEDAFSPDIHEEMNVEYNKFITTNHWVEASASTQV